MLQLLLSTDLLVGKMSIIFSAVTQHVLLALACVVATLVCEFIEILAVTNFFIKACQSQIQHPSLRITRSLDPYVITSRIYILHLQQVLDGYFHEKYILCIPPSEIYFPMCIVFLFAHQKHCKSRIHSPRKTVTLFDVIKIQ